MAANHSHLDALTPFWPGTNLTSQHNGKCYGNVTLCENSDVLCTLSLCDLTLAHFTYLPSLGGNAFFAALFGLCIIAQVGLGAKYKTWGYLIAACFGLVGEVIGYVSRIMMHSNPFSKNNFLIYLVCLTIAPAFLSAGIYLCLARIVVVYGEHISRFPPRVYTILFCTCDFISLLLQAIGGAIASTANDANTTQMGINIMIAGLAFQVFSLALFGLLCGDFALRVRQNRSGWNMHNEMLFKSIIFKTFLWGLGAATLTIFIRSCFRVAELSGGFHGPLANNQPTFMALEGAMVGTAGLCLTILHPGIGFRGTWYDADFNLFRPKKVNNEVDNKSVRSSPSPRITEAI